MTAISPRRSPAPSSRALSDAPDAPAARPSPASLLIVPDVPSFVVTPSSPLAERDDAGPSHLVGGRSRLGLGAPALARSAAASTESFSCASQDESAKVRGVYTMIDKLPGGVPGDGYDDGVELTRERRTASWDDRLHQATDRRRDDSTREDALLAQVDRFGFFTSSAKASASSHQRVVLLARDALAVLPPSKLSASSSTSLPPPARSIVRRDPALKRASVETISAILPSERGDVGRELRRIDKWARMLQVAARDRGGNATHWRLGSDADAMRRARRRTYKGVPDRWRPAAWVAAVDVGWSYDPVLATRSNGISQPSSPASSHASSGSRWSMRRSTSRTADPPPAKETQGMRSRRREDWDDARARFESLADVPCDSDVQIDLDVPRTTPGHVLFHTRYGRGQRALFRVLHAFALLCVDGCGYCQGMGPIASTLLCYLEPATAYAVLARLHDDPRYGLHDMFSPGFPGLHESFAVHDDLVRYLMPEVAAVLERHGIDTSAYATKWYITLFASVVPFASQVRLWDAYLLDGADVIVLAGIAVVWALRGTLLAPAADFEVVLGALGSFLIIEDDDAWLRWIARVGSRPRVRDRIVQARTRFRLARTA